jgi:exoribonuclease-2
MEVLKQNSLVLYKNRPARLVRLGDRLEIEMEGAEIARVRPKDVLLLHPGPLQNLSELRPQAGDIQTAWEILSGGRTTLSELAELAYGVFSPASAWAAWQHVASQVLFTGTPDDIRVCTAEEVEQKQQERAQAEAEKQTWKSFIDRTRRGLYDPADRSFFAEVENLAFGRSQRSQVLREIGMAETPENAHALLLDLGIWDAQVNPYPVREGVSLKQVDLPVPPLPAEDRLDLTHLQSFAIDDEGTDTPDDAVSLDGERIWVHVADVSALVEPVSEIDIEARSLGMSLHLPEGTIHLLPREVTLRLGLGMQEISPALSFGMVLDRDGTARDFSITPSWIRVQRLSYDQAEQVVEEEPLNTLSRLLDAARERRRAHQAVMIDFPEVKLTVNNGLVEIQPILPLRSRVLVEEAMILCGAQTAQFAMDHGICLPFSQQDAVETTERPATLSAMFAFRRNLKRSRFRTSPSPHYGLGLPAYTQVTSPLRRYLDLVGHQQLRAALKGKKGLDEAEVGERIAVADVVTGSLRQAEVRSERHWTLVYLLQHPGWRGNGILVDRRGSSGTVLIPDLALEARVHLKQNWPLDQVLPLALTGVNLPQQEASFRVVD